PQLHEMASQINLASMVIGKRPSQQVQEWFWYIGSERLWLWKVNAIRSLFFAVAKYTKMTRFTAVFKRGNKKDNVSQKNFTK
ncbi:MAG: hypothetical protein WBN88_00380, partial [Anderseniella sp.]